jgi:hypothetical protein
MAVWQKVGKPVKPRTRMHGKEGDKKWSLTTRLSGAEGLSFLRTAPGLL